MGLTRRLWPVIGACAFLVGCGSTADMSAAAGTGQGGDYNATKQMVVDILRSSDGQQAITQAMQNPQFRGQLAVSDADVAKAVEKQLTADKNKSFLIEQMKDPKFANTFAKAAQPELVDIQKQLMKDPAYQKDVLVLLKSPEYASYLNDLMKSPQYRSEIMKIMTEALKNPSFKMQFQDALKSAVAESMQSGGGKSSGGGGGGNGEQSKS